MQGDFLQTDILDPGANTRKEGRKDLRTRNTTWTSIRR